MSKAVLRSVKPYWIYLILTKRKTIEIGKSHPKDKHWNNKVYLYCSKDMKSFNRIPDKDREWMQKLLGRIVCEFTCEEVNLITQVSNMMSNKADYRAVSADGTLLSDDTFDFAQLTKKEVAKYLDGRNGYAWHISDLKIYDKPKDLIEFRKCCKYRNDDNSCRYQEVECDCVKFNFNPDYSLNIAKCLDYMSRPPQSWCYVED